MLDLLRVLAAVVAAFAFPAAALGWGGTYTAPDGTPVQIEVSQQYAQDDALPQKWANYLGSLVHGPELATLRVQLMPLLLVHRSCGVLAIACYSPVASTMVVSADDVPGGPTAEEVVAHEYGHHIATNRLNPPWRAVAWGTKRWASYENVCALAATGQLRPGDEGNAYALNPGEAFAEAYRVLVETRAGVAVPPWNLVDPILRPDATALELLREDVLDPWTQNAASTLTGSFGGGSVRIFRFATPLDGRLALTLRGPRALSMTLWNGPVLLDSGRAISFGLCGERHLTLRVARAQGGAGPFTVDVSKP